MGTGITKSWESYGAEIEEADRLATWKPMVEGEILAGRVVRITRETGRDAKSTLVELERQDGQPAALWLGAVLLTKFEKHRITEGDVVAIKYFGKRKGVSGLEYRSFGVTVIERAGADALDTEF